MGGTKKQHYPQDPMTTEVEQDITEPKPDKPSSPSVNVSNPQPKQNQKIVAWPNEPVVKQPSFFTQDNVNIAQILDQPINNTRAKQMMMTITKEFALVVKEYTIHHHISLNRELEEYAGSIMDG